MLPQSNRWTSGSTQEGSIIWLPPLPVILSEWAGLVPLVVHFASYQYEHHTVGEIALLGRIRIDLFPKLGVLAGLARLLECGPAFLDKASMRGSSSSKVWDVQWGSSFPSANGAASEIITRYALARSKNPIIMVPESTNATREDLRSLASPGDTGRQLCSTKTQFRRPQTLHLLRCSRTSASIKRTRRQILATWAKNCLLLLYMSMAVVLGLCGCFGTCIILVIAVLSDLVLSTQVVVRPNGYLQSNEEINDAHMLVATHENANIWFLFSGDRGLVDTLLNKTMFSLPPSRLTPVLVQYLRLAHVLQLAIMTYAAAQKGWEGLSLLLVVMTNHILGLRYRDFAMASQWLGQNGIDINVNSFDFSGRTIMLGAVQAFSKSKTTRWLDEILIPHPRREAFLTRIERPEEFSKEGWSSHDLKTIMVSSELAKVGAGMLQGCNKSTV